jgi:enoyl-CoA hydratase
MAEPKNTLWELTDGVGRLTLNRPEKLNALNSGTLTEIREALRSVEEDNDVKVIVIAARGRFFCAGGDLEESKAVAGDFEASKRMSMLGHSIFNALETYPKPVVAAVQGDALAGGLELVESCDIVIAADNARFGDQHINFGLIPGGGSTQRLPRLIGIRKAKELLFTGDWISAQEAERLGLVNRVVPPDKLEEAVGEICNKLKVKSPLALRTMKNLVRQGMQVDLATGLELELLATQNHSRSADFLEGLAAFNEKRKPRFTGH